MLAEDLNSLARCVELLGIGCLTEQSMPELVQIIVSTITQHFERQTERNQKRKDEDYDEGVEDQVKILKLPDFSDLSLILASMFLKIHCNM